MTAAGRRAPQVSEGARISADFARARAIDETRDVHDTFRRSTVCMTISMLKVGCTPTRAHGSSNVQTRKHDFWPKTSVQPETNRSRARTQRVRDSTCRRPPLTSRAHVKSALPPPRPPLLLKRLIVKLIFLLAANQKRAFDRSSLLTAFALTRTAARLLVLPVVSISDCTQAKKNLVIRIVLKSKKSKNFAVCFPAVIIFSNFCEQRYHSFFYRFK